MNRHFAERSPGIALAAAAPAAAARAAAAAGAAATATVAAAYGIEWRVSISVSKQEIGVLCAIFPL